MKAAYGHVMWGTQAGKGTGPVSWLPPGILSNATATVRSGMERIYSVGSVQAIELSEGMAVSEVRLSIAALQVPTLIGNVLRVAGELPWLGMRLGYERGATVYYRDIIDCKINRLSLRVERGGRVSADLDLIGGKVTQADADPGTMTFPTERAYRYFEATWSEARDLLGFELNINNNLDAMGIIAGSGTTRDPARIWDYLEEGPQEIDGTVIYFLPDSSLDVQDCLIAASNLSLALTACDDISPTQSITIALNGFKPIDDELDLPQGGDVAVKVPFWATSATIT